jgi:hypothetical protein
MKYLVFLALMVSFAGAQQLKDFEGVYLSKRDGTHPTSEVLKIEQIPNGVKFTEYESYDTFPKDPVSQVRTYTINGKWIKDVKEHSKVRVVFNRRRLRIDTVTDSSGISGVFAHGIRKKKAEEWSLAPDLQTLTLKIRKDEQSVQMPLCDAQDGQILQDLCKEQTSQMTVYGIHENDRTRNTSERAYARRGLLSTAFAEASEKN